ncbi:MAG: hypothetical protein JRN33_02575 [Nitrososphaerota archaeon]|jgi:hypothetical protein|nr:hypothetical protein [Nitrososphaerota archaeon]
MRKVRFSSGLAAGALVALAVVAASGGMSYLGVGFVSASPAHQTNPYSSLTSAEGLTTTAASYTVTGNQTLSAGGTSTQTSASTSLSSEPSVSASPQGASFLPSPDLQTLPKQPPLSDAFLLVPILVAFLIGAALYRASKERTEPGE